MTLNNQPTDPLAFDSWSDYCDAKSQYYVLAGKRHLAHQWTSDATVLGGQRGGAGRYVTIHYNPVKGGKRDR